MLLCGYGCGIAHHCSAFDSSHTGPDPSCGIDFGLPAEFDSLCFISAKNDSLAFLCLRSSRDAGARHQYYEFRVSIKGHADGAHDSLRLDLNEFVSQ